MPASKIEVISDPGGVPPEIGKAWIGCQMPVYKHSNNCGHIKVWGTEVVSGASVKSDGYDVVQSAAIATLKQLGTRAALKAVRWWRAHGYPHPNECFRFPLSSVRVIEERPDPEGVRVQVWDDLDHVYR